MLFNILFFYSFLQETLQYILLLQHIDRLKSAPVETNRSLEACEQVPGDQNGLFRMSSHLFPFNHALCKSSK